MGQWPQQILQRLTIIVGDHEEWVIVAPMRHPHPGCSAAAELVRNSHKTVSGEKGLDFSRRADDKKRRGFQHGQAGGLQAHRCVEQTFSELARNLVHVQVPRGNYCDRVGSQGHVAQDQRHLSRKKPAAQIVRVVEMERDRTCVHLEAHRGLNSLNLDPLTAASGLDRDHDRDGKTMPADLAGK